MLPKLKPLTWGVMLFLAAAMFTSCRKVDVGGISDSGKKPFKNPKPNKASVSVEEYSSVIFDSCRAENVALTGTAQYKLIESFTNGYYIYYEIKLEKITGVGEITGTVYHGGGKILGVTKVSEDGMDKFSKASYKVKYVANNGNQIIFNQTSKFIVRDTVIKVETNYIMDTCK